MHAITNYAILLLQFETFFIGYFLLREDLNYFLLFQFRIVIVNRCDNFILKMILIVQLVSYCQALLWLDSDPGISPLLAQDQFVIALKSCTHSEPNYASTTWIIIQFRYPQPCIAYLHLILYYSLTLHSLIDLSRSFGSIKEKSYNNIVCQRYLTIYKDIPYLYYYNCTWSNLSISDLQLFCISKIIYFATNLFYIMSIVILFETTLSSQTMQLLPFSRFKKGGLNVISKVC